MELFFKVLLGTLIFLFGASIGSFASAFIFRYERHLSIVKGRSICPSCNTTLKWYDLIPVFSFLLLKRKCRYCKAPIPLEGFLMEVGFGALAAFLFFAYNMSYYFLYIFFILSVLLCIFIVDCRTMEIPYSLNIALLLLGITEGFISSDITWLERGIGLIVVSLPLLILALVIKESFGGGDIFLMASAGVLLGYKLLIFALFVGLVVGGIQGVYLLLTKKKGKKEHFAFGPALTIGIAISLFFGDNIVSWYLGLMA
ncbi:MAG: prepilin peptidase [Clostridiales bacterium]|nr:prepilin peptidase [Clostridiales bacterium]